MTYNGMLGGCVMTVLNQQELAAHQLNIFMAATRVWACSEVVIHALCAHQDNITRDVRDCFHLGCVLIVQYVLWACLLQDAHGYQVEYAIPVQYVLLVPIALGAMALLVVHVLHVTFALQESMLSVLLEV